MLKIPRPEELEQPVIDPNILQGYLKDIINNLMSAAKSGYKSINVAFFTMNPHYQCEIERLLIEAGYKVDDLSGSLLYTQISWG